MPAPVAQCLGGTRPIAKKEFVGAHCVGLCPFDPVLDVILFDADIADQILTTHFVAGCTSIEQLQKIHGHVLWELFDDRPCTHHEAARRRFRELAVPHQLEEIMPDHGAFRGVAFFDRLLEPLRVAFQIHQRTRSYKFAIHMHVRSPSALTAPTFDP